MSEALLKSVQDKLTEEKWTRAVMSGYSKSDFQELGAIIEEAKNLNCIDEIKAVVDEHLAHTKNSIIGLYLSGMLSLKKKTLDDSALVTLINIFKDNKRMPVVMYLCDTILAEDPNNRNALRTIAECYKAEDNEKLWDVYESLVRIDHEEADLAKVLAEKYERDGDAENATDYYKKALLRYVNRGVGNQIKEVWSKLVTLIPEEIDFFYLVQGKIAKTLSADKSALLMHELYNYYRDSQQWNIAIDILKLILSYDDKDEWARKEIELCFRAKYADHSQLEDCIRVSNLTQKWRNVFEAISDFEKHISFDERNFVFHRSWGVGIIRSVKGDEIQINFGKTHGVRNMSLKMAVDALQPLDKDHIWVLKARKSRDELAKMVKNDKAWALKTIIRSFNNNCDFKRIKAELVPSVLTASEWTSWSTGARKILDEDSTFAVNANDITMYTVRDRAITQEEKLANEFKAQKNFFARIDILMKFAHDDEADKTSEQFSEMFNYFVSYLKSFSTVNEQIIASFLVVRSIVAANPALNPNIPYTFAQLFAELENPREVYTALKDTKNTSLRPDFLTCIKDLLPNWADVYVRLFPCVLKSSLIASLLDSGNKDKLKQLVLNCFENYRDYREAVIFFFKESQEEEWFKELNISYDKQLITLIHILDLTYREIANHCDTTENRKINRQIQVLLFKNDTLLKYILENDEDTITRLYTLVDDVKDLDGAIKMNMRNRILETHPDFKFHETEEKATTAMGLIVTTKMLEVKKQRLETLLKVEIPANSKEISDAMAQGDLKENAEYKAAKELQAQLGAEAGRLEADLARAKIFDPTTVTTVRVSFGTTVTIKNEDTGKPETYTILGPWESDPEHGIISYLSPLGNALLGAKPQEKLEFTINEENRNYTVESIAVAKF